MVLDFGAVCMAVAVVFVVGVCLLVSTKKESVDHWLSIHRDRDTIIFHTALTNIPGQEKNVQDARFALYVESRTLH